MPGIDADKLTVQVPAAGFDLCNGGHNLWVSHVFQCVHVEATDELIVELSTDPQARAELLKQWVSTFGRQKWDVPTDTGQKYLDFWWD